MNKHTSHTRLDIYQAEDFQSAVRLEVIGISQNVLRINENTHQEILKLNEWTLDCLRDVLNRWHENKNRKINDMEVKP